MSTCKLAYLFNYEAAQTLRYVSLSPHIDWYGNFTSSFPVPLEKLVVTREHMNNWYSLEAYHISKLLAELPLQVSCMHLEIRRSYENE